ncbi:MAG: hypothetical protein RR359_03405 [Bacilli bacterium]
MRYDENKVREIKQLYDTICILKCKLDFLERTDVIEVKCTSFPKKS